MTYVPQVHHTGSNMSIMHIYGCCGEGQVHQPRESMSDDISRLVESMHDNGQNKSPRAAYTQMRLRTGQGFTLTTVEGKGLSLSRSSCLSFHCGVVGMPKRMRSRSGHAPSHHHSSELRVSITVFQRLSNPCAACPWYRTAADAFCLRHIPGHVSRKGLFRLFSSSLNSTTLTSTISAIS